MTQHHADDASHADRQRSQWSQTAHDWAGIQEPRSTSLYWSVLSDAGVGHGVDLLDAGCGGGVACRIASHMGATVTGVDVAPDFLEIARHRAPQARFEIGSIDDLPFEDASFDVVTAFSSIMFAADPAAAATELARVARPGATVAVVVPMPEESDWWAFIGAIVGALPEMPSEGAQALDLSQGEPLRTLLGDAGLSPGAAATRHVVWSYPDDDTAERAMMSSGPMAGAVAVLGEERVREIGLEALGRLRSRDGSYHLDAYFNVVLASR